jgi:hypothetical protein
VLMGARLCGWCQRCQSRQGFQHITIQMDGRVEFHAPVHDAVPDASDRCS